MYLQQNKIETMIHYPIPLFEQKAYSNSLNDDLPITKQLHNEILSIPISPIMSEDDAHHVSNILNLYV